MHGMIGAEVSDGLVTIFLGVALTSLLAFATWLVKEIFNVSKIIAALVVKVEGLDDRVEHLEQRAA